MRVLVCLSVFLVVSASAAERPAKQMLDGPFKFDLIEVIDGDTFRARVHIWLGQSVTTKVRLTGVDTPEMNAKCVAEKKLARRAKAFAQKWLAANEVRLTNVHYGTYAGRVLATTQSQSGGTLGAALMQENLAKPYRGKRADWCV